MTDIDRLRKQEEVGNALREMRSHHGFKHFQNLVQEYYTDMVKSLIDTGAEEARLTIKAIDHINEMFELGISLADNAANELKQNKLRETWDTSDFGNPKN